MIESAISKPLSHSCHGEELHNLLSWFQGRCFFVLTKVLSLYQSVWRLRFSLGGLWEEIKEKHFFSTPETSLSAYQFTLTLWVTCFIAQQNWNYGSWTTRCKFPPSSTELHKMRCFEKKHVNNRNTRYLTIRVMRWYLNLPVRWCSWRYFGETILWWRTGLWCWKIKEEKQIILHIRKHTDAEGS